MNEIRLSADGSTLTVFVPMTWRRRGGRKVIVAPAGCDDWTPPPRIDNTLIKALARAHRWRRTLEDGAYGTMAEMADAERISRSYVSRVLRLIRTSSSVSWKGGRRLGSRGSWSRFRSSGRSSGSGSVERHDRSPTPSSRQQRRGPLGCKSAPSGPTKRWTADRAG